MMKDRVVSPLAYVEVDGALSYTTPAGNVTAVSYPLAYVEVQERNADVVRNPIVYAEIDGALTYVTPAGNVTAVYYPLAYLEVDGELADRAPSPPVVVGSGCNKWLSMLLHVYGLKG